MSDIDRNPDPTISDTQGRDESGVRRKAIEAYDSARQGVSDAGRKASDAIDDAPLIALAGGLAAGALIAALLPRSRAEQRMLGPVGEKIGSRARAAAEAARDAGRSRLEELGLTPDAGSEKLKSLLEGAGDAARASAQAAVSAAREPGSGKGR